MNYNLSKLLKNEVIPQIHEATLSIELKDYGTLQYTKYNDGGVHFNLLDAKEDVDLEAIKQIVLSHSYETGKLKEDNDKVIEARIAEYNKFTNEMLEILRLSFPEQFKAFNDKAELIKLELPKIV